MTPNGDTFALDPVAALKDRIERLEREHGVAGLSLEWRRVR